MIVQEILNWLSETGHKFTFRGDGSTEIGGFSSLDNYRPGTITWAKKEENYIRYKESVDAIIPTLIIQQSGIHTDALCTLTTDSSKEVFFAILHRFWGGEIKNGGIGEGTVISGNVQVSGDVTIGCNCTICGDIEIGENSVIEHNVVIQGNVRIGRNCHIQSGAVIGIDGFGYSQDVDTKKKTMVEHFGGVSIGNDVFIGSHVNIARGTIDDTVIGDGTKIAPSTHIGHNNQIGEDAAIICSTLYGSVRVGSRAYITDSTVQNQLTVGCDTVVGMGSLVTKNIEDDVIAYGVPARAIRKNASML